MMSENVRPTLIIGNKNYSSWSMRGWLVLSHLKMDFDVIRVPLFTNNYKETLLRYSPAGLVPVFIDQSTVIWDSLAICEYVAESHPELWPADRAVRALARSICAEMHSGFVALRSELPMNCRASQRSVSISSDARRDVERVCTIWSSCRSSFGDNGDWLFGAFSIADVMYAPVASRFRTYDIALPEAAADYRDTVLNHPGVRQWYADSACEEEVIQKAELGIA